MAGNQNSGRRRKPLDVLRPEEFSGEIQPPKGKPEMPEGMDDVATEHWRYVIELQAEWVDVIDGPALRVMCETWSLLRTTIDLAKYCPENKEIRCAVNSYVQQWERLAAKFGMTPADRAKFRKKSTETVRDKTAKYLA